MRLSPSDQAAASLTFAFTTYPGVLVHAGVLHDFPYPTCGCDACDETTLDQVQDLEDLVFAVVAGHYKETYVPGADLPVRFTVESDGGHRGQQSSTDGYPAQSLAAAQTRLRQLPTGWAPWPTRS